MRYVSMKLVLVLALLTVAIVTQETRWAAIPRSNTPLLWASMLLAIVAYGVLRSGWGRADRHANEQRSLGTISNSFYEPRRAAFMNTFTIAGGLAGAMWWGATSWLMLVRAIERESPTRGLVNLQVCVAVGILSGGMAGAALGLSVGEWWERTHRRRRSSRVLTD